MSKQVYLLHHWLVTYRGGEKVLDQFMRLYPDSAIGTLVYSQRLLPKSITKKEVIASCLNGMPGADRIYREMLPLHPWAIRRMQVPEGVRWILSSDAAMIKGVPVPQGVKHVCYCHSPPRYLWGMADQYVKNAGIKGALKGVALKSVLGYLKRFDYAAAQRVDQFVANSRFVAGRIKRAYGRSSIVVYPPVDVGSFSWDRPKQKFHLIVSHLVPYKRVDLAVQAYRNLPVKLIVIGDGPEKGRLQSMANGNIHFLGSQPFAKLKDYMETAAAFVYPQIEDFGITAIEAQAAGCPVIAYKAGGAEETVVDGRSGVFFDVQEREALEAAAMRVISGEYVFHPEELNSIASSFSADRFCREMAGVLRDMTFPETGY